MTNSETNLSREKLDILVIVREFWNGKRTIIRFVLIASFFGGFVALVSPKKFMASTVFIPQMNEEDGGAGNLGGLAALAGVNIGGSGSNSDIPPSIYPRIVASTKFKSELVESRLLLSNLDSSISYSNYYKEYHNESALDKIKKYTIGLPSTILETIRGSNDIQSDDKPSKILKLTSEEIINFKRIDAQLTVQFNKMDGIVTLNYSMEDPFLAAQMANASAVLLQEEIRRYKVQSASDQLDFIERRFLIKKAEYEKIQRTLAEFRDSNQNISSAVARNESDRLESERDFAFNLYVELAKQLEQAKLQKEKDIPIFTVIQPVVVPHGKSAPNRVLILVSYVFLGLVFGTVYIMIKAISPIFKTKWMALDNFSN